MRRRCTSIRLAASAAAALLLVSVGAVVALGQAQKQRGTIALDLQVSDAALQRHPVMVSAIRDGRIVAQEEDQLGSGTTLRSDSITVGTYDVRVEGAGIVTEEKRGVHVFGGQSSSLIFQLKPGKGVRIVEYATGALSREEVAARLAKLESQVAELSKPRPQK